MIITIDGPSASGKSSTARAVAQKLHFYHLNSGLMYRALAYVLMHEKAYTMEQIASPVHDDVLQALEHIEYRWDAVGTVQIQSAGNTITTVLKDSLIAQVASIISTNPFVREQINHYLNDRYVGHNVIADGRDCGSVVFPSAELKLFLTASTAVRAQRWQHDQKKLGNIISLEQAEAQIIERDTRDSQRSVAPLIIPDGAVVIDNSAMTFDETVDTIVAMV